MTRSVLTLVAIAWLLARSTAHAYSDPSQFAVDVLEAGGGGRYYTGSPADGYACNSCHAGGEEPAIELAGVPARYVPGATYELRVTWPAALEHSAAMLELTDEHGRGAGSVALPAAGTHVDAELCEPTDAGVPGAQLHAADPQRTIVATPDCGARALRLQWTAPARSVGPVWLAGAVLASNHDGDVQGDGVTLFAQPIPAFGEELPDLVASGTCGVARSAAPARGALLAGTVLVAVGLTRARRRMRTASAGPR